MTRRLLSINKVADKLDMTLSTFRKRRQHLEAEGFPPPSLPRDEFGSARWDEAAINAWLDTRLPRSLSQPPAIDISATLMRRAQELRI